MLPEGVRNSLVLAVAAAGRARARRAGAIRAGRSMYPRRRPALRRAQWPGPYGSAAREGAVVRRPQRVEHAVEGRLGRLGVEAGLVGVRLRFRLRLRFGLGLGLRRGWRFHGDWDRLRLDGHGLALGPPAPPAPDPAREEAPRNGLLNRRGGRRLRKDVLESGRREVGFGLGLGLRLRLRLRGGRLRQGGRERDLGAPARGLDRNAAASVLALPGNRALGLQLGDADLAERPE